MKKIGNKRKRKEKREKEWKKEKKEKRKKEKELQGSDTINRNADYCCIHSSVWDWQQLLTGERLERFYLFSRLKHLLEYISVYE